MDKYQNKYRIPSARLQNWDYRWAGAYFITICTQHRIHYFGHISEGKMKLSPVGEIAETLWYEIKNHAVNVNLGAFVVMPNHIHGILILMGNGDPVETGHALSLPSPSPSHSIGHRRFQHIGNNSVSSIIGAYKSAVSKHTHHAGCDFAWQTRFYDHVIRDQASYQKISDYIINNPSKWNDDKFYGR